MTIVVDASVAATWLLPDESDEAADDVLEQVRRSGGFAPSIFRHEVRNIVLLAERRSRITRTVGDALLNRLATLPIQDSGTCDDSEVMELARAHRLTAYDACYLALAIASGLPLATPDRALAAAARTCGVPLLGPLAS